MTKKVSKSSKMGRPKGSRNSTSLGKVRDILAAKKLHPVSEMLKLLPELTPGEQAKLWMSLLRYVEPMLKEAEVSAEDKPKADESREISNEQILRALA